MSFLLPKIPPSIVHSHTIRSQNTLFPPPPLLTTGKLEASRAITLMPVSELQEKLPTTVAAVEKKELERFEREKDEFYLNLGVAVRTLRDDLPAIFDRDLDYSIYREDITFVDPLNNFHGMDNYKLLFWALRFHAKILFKDIGLEIFRVWQPSETMILIRWELQGVPRVPWEARGCFQGTSRYKLDRNGKIYEHRVDNVAFNFPRVTRPTRLLDLVAAACPASPNLTFQWDVVEDDVAGASAWLELYREVHCTLNQEKLGGLVTCL